MTGCDVFAVTIIEIRPFRNGWQVDQAPGVQPAFVAHQEQAIDYATGRACFRATASLCRFSFSHLSEVSAPILRHLMRSRYSEPTAQAAVSVSAESTRPADTHISEAA